MKDIKTKMNMSDEMKRKQRRLQQQFKNIERRKQQNWKMQSNYGKSIDYIAESPLLRSKLKQIAKHNQRNKRKIFHRRFKQAANSLIEKANDEEVFSAGDEPISSVQVGKGYGASTIDFAGVIRDLHKDSREKAEREPISTRIKRKRSMMPDTIGKELTVSSIFDPYFHVTNSGEMVDVTQNSEVRGDVVAALQSEYCSNTYNRHNEHRDTSTEWYDFVDINSIGIQHHYEPIPATEEIINDTETIILSDDQTQIIDNSNPLNKLDDPNRYRMYDLPRAQMDGGAKCTVTNNLHLLKMLNGIINGFDQKLQ